MLFCIVWPIKSSLICFSSGDQKEISLIPWRKKGSSFDQHVLCPYLGFLQHPGELQLFLRLYFFYLWRASWSIEDEKEELFQIFLGQVQSPTHADGLLNLQEYLAVFEEPYMHLIPLLSLLCFLASLLFSPNCYLCLR